VTVSVMVFTRDLRLADNPALAAAARAPATVPLFVLEPAHVREIYGEAALELVLPEDRPHEKVLDLVCRPERYAGAVREIRQHLAEKHSHAARLRRLLEIIES